MNFNIKGRRLITLFLVLVMIVSSLFATNTMKLAKAQLVPTPTGDVSVVAFGTTPATFGGVTNTWTQTTGAPKVGTTTYKSYQIAVDVRLDNSLNGFDSTDAPMSGVWGYSFDLSWSIPTLQLVKVVNGGYLNTGDDTPSDLFNAGVIDNAHGDVGGGVADAISESPTVNSLPTADGVLVTLIFTVTNTGTATVNVSNVHLDANSAEGIALTGPVPTSINNAQISLGLASWPLTVTSAYGSPNPAVGIDNIPKGLPLTANVSSPVVVGVSTYVCTGWTGSGSVPASGTGTSTTFTITQASTITWNWQSSGGTNTLIVISAHGSPNPAVGSPSYTSGTSVTASVSSPVTESGATYVCTGWSGTGSVPATGTGTSTTFTITADSSITWNWQLQTGGSSVNLVVSSAHGSPNPAVGTYAHNSGDSVTCNVPTIPVSVSGVTYNTVTDGGVIYACIGWSGTGSVQASGSTTSTTFTITSSSTLTWNWILIPASVDVWTSRGGKGYDVSSNSFGPQQQVTLFANVTSPGGVPMAQATVTFNIFDNGPQIDSRTATTNGTGIATVLYRLPWPATNPTSAFGIMNITSTVNVAGSTKTDSCPFMYNYILHTTSVTITNNDDHSLSNGPSFSRYTGPAIKANITVTNISWNTTSFYLTATIYDNNNVPVAYVSLPETINPAQTGNPNNTHSQTYTISLTLPSYAFVGPATLFVNIYTDNPTNLGVPFCLEASAPLIIDASK